MLQKIRGQWFDPARVVGLVESYDDGKGKWVRVALEGGDSEMLQGTVDEVAGEINEALRLMKLGFKRVTPEDAKQLIESMDGGMVAMTHARLCDGGYHYREQGAASCQCGSMKVDLPPLPEAPERADLLEDAHILLCNVSGGNLDMQDGDWRAAWYKFRQKYQDFIRRYNAQMLRPESSGAHPLQCEEMIGAMRCQLARGHDGLHVPYRGPKCGKTWTEYGWARSCVLEAGHVGGCLENYASEPKEGGAFIDEELRCQPHEHFQMAGWTQCLCGELTGLDVASCDQLRVNPRPAGMMNSDPPTLAQRVLNKEGRER